GAAGEHDEFAEEHVTGGRVESRRPDRTLDSDPEAGLRPHDRILDEACELPCEMSLEFRTQNALQGNRTEPREADAGTALDREVPGQEGLVVDEEGHLIARAEVPERQPLTDELRVPTRFVAKASA